MIDMGIVLNGFRGATPSIGEMAEFYAIDKSWIPRDRPYVWYMFVETMDGRGSFLHPGKAGGYHVALGHLKDSAAAGRYPELAAGASADYLLLQHGWAEADAMIAASGVLNAEPGNEWRIEDDKIIGYRESLGKKPTIRVLVTGSGSVDLGEKIFSPKKEYETIVFTASEGEETLRKKSRAVERARDYNPLELDSVRVYVLGDGREITDFGKMMQILRKEHDVELLDLQGGPTLAGLFVVQKLIDEYRITISPQIIGDRFYSDGRAAERPTAFKFPDNFTFNPDNSVLTPAIAQDRQVGGHAFLRRKLVYRH